MTEKRREWVVWGDDEEMVDGRTIEAFDEEEAAMIWAERHDVESDYDLTTGGTVVANVYKPRYFTTTRFTVRAEQSTEYYADEVE